MLSPTLPLRCGLSLMLLVAGGCQKDDAETAGQDASSGTGATGTTMTPTGEGTAAGTEGGTGTGGVLTTTEPPTTGDEPVVCDTPEGCTGMGEGDLEALTLPFFRGRVCVSDTVQPGAALAVSVSTCVHPCLKFAGFKQKWVYRCEDAGCEVGLVFYHPDTTGTACPADVFGEFDPALCNFVEPPIQLDITPPETTGAASLLMAFMTNDDVAAILGGDDEGMSVWSRIDTHAQAPERRLALDFAAENPEAPADCGEGVAGCLCADIGLE